MLGRHEGRPRRSHAGSGNLDQRQLARLPVERHHGITLQRHNVIGGTVLQGTSGVDYRINTVQQARPVPGLCHKGEVNLPPLRVGQPQRHRLHVPRHADDSKAIQQQAANDGRAN